MKPTTEPRKRLERDRRRSVSLTDRDKSLLLDLFLLKAARREHLQRLHFNSVPRCNQRLRALFDAGLVDRYASPYGQIGSIVYSLGTASRKIVRAGMEDDCAQFSPNDFTRQCQKAKSGLLAHTLAVADVYVALRSATHSGSSLQLVAFLPESVVRQEFDIRRTEAGVNGATAWRLVTVAPDGCFILQDGQTRATVALLLEADRGDTGSQIASKLHGYVHFITSGLACQTLGVAVVKVVFVTTGPLRADNLCRLAKKSSLDDVAVCTFNEIDELLVADAIFRIPGATNPINLLEVARRKGA